MEPLVGYIIAGIVCLFILTLILFWNRRRLKPVTDKIAHVYIRAWKYLQYTEVLTRHSWFGPWTAAEVLLYLGYISANVICTTYPSVTTTGLCKQAGTATFINIAYLYCSISADFLAELFGITPKAWQRLHLAVAWMAGFLATLHVGCVLGKGFTVSPGRASNVGPILAYSTILWLLIASVNPLKWLTRNTWLSRGLGSRFHFLFSLAAIVATYIHVVTEIGTSWIIFIAPVCVTMTLLRESWFFLYYNGIFGVQGWTRASFIRLADNTTQINVYPGRPVNVYPGQYIKLWIPISGQFFKPQFRQYHVQSWTSSAQRQIKLFDLPNGPISSSPQFAEMQHVQENGARLAFFTGPYGLHHKYTQYETLFVVIYDYGILSVNAQLQYVYECVENRTSKARRVRLVWQWQKVSSAVYAIPKIAELEGTIDRELDKFSEQIKLPRNLIEYHLGRYVPNDNTTSSDDTESTQDGVKLNKVNSERTNLEREALQHIVPNKAEDSESTKIHKQKLKDKFDAFQEQIGPLESSIGELAAKRRIMDDVLRWVNTTLRRNHERFSLQCSIYREDIDTSYTSGRAEMIGGNADIRNLYNQELAEHQHRIAGDLVENRGKFLIMVSGPPEVHELARSIASAGLDEVDLKEFQYIPGHVF